jgi:hypothetical protein
MSMSRSVGENVAVPQLAIPAMFTAGPARSLGGAESRLRVAWARASFKTRLERLQTAEAASV